MELYNAVRALLMFYLSVNVTLMLASIASLYHKLQQ